MDTSESESPVKVGTLGNTSTKAPSKRGHNWCFTWNNYHLHESESERFKVWVTENCEKANIGKEVGEKCGTPHLQGYIKCKKNILFTSLKKVNDKISWRLCKGSELDNYKYTSKEGDIWLTFGCEVLDDKKPSKAKADVPKKRGGFVIIYDDVEIPPIESIAPPLLRYIDLFNTKPDRRTVHWFCNYKGNLGKTAFTCYMVCTYPNEVRFLNGGKYSDVCSFIYNTNMKGIKMVIFDLPKETNSISYRGLKVILNGMVQNSKYETGTVIFKPPHILVFANWLPDTNQGSPDRWTDVIEYDPENRHLAPGPKRGIDHGLDDDY